MHRILACSSSSSPNGVPRRPAYTGSGTDQQMVTAMAMPHETLRSFLSNALKNKSSQVANIVKQRSSARLAREPDAKMVPLGVCSFLCLTPKAHGAVTSSLDGLQSPALQGIVSAFLLIFFSEIGDKTFFVALLLALQNSKSAVFIGTFGALTVMTLISVGIGQALHVVDSLAPSNIAQFPIDDILAIGLLVWFGILTLRGAGDAKANVAAEQKEAEKGLQDFLKGSQGLILSTFALVFSAEWGDKSFLATTALSATSSPFGVTIGAVGGHFLATVLAVVGGSFLSNYISEKSLQYIGGSLFLVFALTTALSLFNKVSL